MPVDDMTALPDAGSQGEVSGDPSANTTIWPAIYPELLQLVEEHTTTLVFVNYRRLVGAPRAAPQRAGRARGGPRPPRLAGARGPHAGGGGAEARRAEVPGGHVLAGARHRHGRDRPGRADRVARLGGARPAARSAGPATRSARRPRAGSSRSSAATWWSAPSSRGACTRARSRRPASRATRSTCCRSRSWRPARPTSGRSTTCSRSSGARTRTASCRAPQFDGVLDMLSGRYPSDDFAELRPRIVWDRDRRQRHRPVERPPAGGRQRRHDPRPRPVRRVPGRRLGPRRRAGRGDGLRGARRPGVRARRLVVAHRADHPRPRARLPRAGPGRARSRSGRARRPAARSSSAGRSARSCARPAR